VADARFLLRPRWLLSHVLVVLLVVVMVNLGFWQLRRLDFKRDRNALIEARMDQPVVAVDDLLGPDADAAAVDAARYRRVSATGTYDDDTTLVVRNRTQDGAPGGWLVTPMTVAPGTTVGVVRGFVGFDPGGDLVAAPAPEGQVTVEGLVIDPGRIDGTAPRDLAPFLAGDGVVPALVLARDSTPPEPAAPTDAREPTIGPIVPVPPPELSEGPHLGYAVQWFIFSTIAIVGYPIVLRRVIARRGKEVDDDGPDPESSTPWPATRT
jgi:cytochrome oxidase assembly protein ShyY1